jgi:hypothetical protein
MKHLKKFNESEEVTFKNSDVDIQLFFTDYTDDNPDSLKIIDGLVVDGKFISDTTYLKDGSKYRRAKLVKLNVAKPNGISIGMNKCLTDIEVLSNLLSDINRFYDMSGEEINYVINTDYMGLNLEFVVLGDFVKPEESQAKKIDEYLTRVRDWVRKKGHKTQTINGNWLNMRFKRGGGPLGYDYIISDKLRKVGNGDINLNNYTQESDKELIEIRNEAWEDGLKFSVSGGDNQVVLKLVKI